MREREKEREKAGVSEGESGQPFLVVVCSPERGRRMEGRMSKKEEEDWKSSEEISLYKVEDIKKCSTSQTQIEMHKRP